MFGKKEEEMEAADKYETARNNCHTQNKIQDFRKYKIKVWRKRNKWKQLVSIRQHQIPARHKIQETLANTFFNCGK